MTENEICDHFVAELDFMCAGGGHPAHWRQENYRSHFYALFTAGQPLGFNGDRMMMAVRPMLSEDDPSYDDKMQIICEVGEAWNEWEYARSQP